jgi:hypothetical protein
VGFAKSKAHSTLFGREHMKSQNPWLLIVPIKPLKKISPNYCKAQKGFTLIELLIIVGIPAILAAVIIPNVTIFRNT